MSSLTWNWCFGGERGLACAFGIFSIASTDGAGVGAFLKEQGREAGILREIAQLEGGSRIREVWAVEESFQTKEEMRLVGAAAASPERSRVKGVAIRCGHCGVPQGFEDIFLVYFWWKWDTKQYFENEKIKNCPAVCSYKVIIIIIVI